MCSEIVFSSGFSLFCDIICKWKKPKFPTDGNRTYFRLIECLLASTELCKRTRCWLKLRCAIFKKMFGNELCFFWVFFFFGFFFFLRFLLKTVFLFILLIYICIWMVSCAFTVCIKKKTTTTKKKKKKEKKKSGFYVRQKIIQDNLSRLNKRNWFKYIKRSEKIKMAFKYGRTHKPKDTQL